MIKTKITELFGIEHPIVQLAVANASGPELVAAVAGTGGLGFLPAAGFQTQSALLEGIDRIKALTDRPFGLSLGFWMGAKDIEPEAYLEAVKTSGVGIVEISGLSSYLYTDLLRSSGVKMVHTCKSVKEARNSQKAGADAVILSGIEGLGTRSDLDIGSAVFIPAAADGLKVPIIASGGFADGRGLAAALCLGADAIGMATRFVMTAESAANPGIKGYLLQALEGDTILVEASATKGLRVLKTPVSEKLYIQKKRGEKIKLEDMGEGPYATGDFSNGLLTLGQSIGLIKDFPPAATVIEQILEEANTVAEKTHRLFS